jgi:hypothetical protein
MGNEFMKGGGPTELLWFLLNHMEKIYFKLVKCICLGIKARSVGASPRPRHMTRNYGSGPENKVLAQGHMALHMTKGLENGVWHVHVLAKWGFTL